MSSTTTPALNAGRDTPNVLLFPPLIPLAMLAISLLLDRIVPLSWLERIPLSWRIGAGVLAIAAGAFVAICGERAIRRHGTNVLPTRPTLAIATDGIYARTRNPIYVGQVVLSFGIILIFALDWMLPLYPLGMLLLHYGIVLREERYLERKFGDAYRAYRNRVPRYI